MPVQFKIKVTKEILERSQGCGAYDDVEKIGNNCAIAIALKDLFPDVLVTAHHIYPFGIYENNEYSDLRIAMPKIALDFVKVFDSLRSIPKVRLHLPEFEFEISIPDEIISQINIDEVKNMVEENSFLSQKPLLRYELQI
ncbi:MAG: hypothetical protein KGM16_06605 [Bacteroidota bacterium]|nr:hypothetical protein [Bacteroidota bacterium]